ncbi:methyltransferase domain-containing protein [Neofusicoccum parvum]|nr:methyltransferase domain-containing protein [Neofusicoccum parvum]
MAEVQEQQPLPQPGTRSKDVPWFSNKVLNLTEQARKLLEEYSGIPPEKVEAHVLEVRDKAWDIHPYPCIGMFRFLDFNMSSESYYPEILSRLKNGEQLLDLGCCFGQELRQLIHDGAPPTSLHGTDLRGPFLTLSHTLFIDAHILPPSRLLAADIFDDGPASPLAPLAGTLSVIHASSFFHLFGRADQLRAAERCVALLRPAPGVAVVGRQVGSRVPGERAAGQEGRVARFMHDVASWARLWQEVGERTGTRWEVEGRMGEVGEEVGMEELRAWAKRGGQEGLWWLAFVVRRVE